MPADVDAEFHASGGNSLIMEPAVAIREEVVDAGWAVVGR
jgi:hypothetical protein